MGMSSSQARLLNLTSRMHQIEYKAAKLEAEKLQMANQSSRVYNEYLEALDKTSINVNILGQDASITNTPITADMIYQYGGLSDQYALVTKDNKTLISSELHEKYKNTNSLSEFLANIGINDTFQQTVHHSDPNPAYQNAVQNYQNDHAQWTTNKTAFDNYQTDLNSYNTRYANWQTQNAAYTQYQTDLAKYNTEHAQWVANSNDYNKYQTDLAKYNQLHAAWENSANNYNDYVTAHTQWEADHAAWVTRRDAYNTYLTQQAAHDKWVIDKNAYNQYLSDKAAYDAWEAQNPEYVKSDPDQPWWETSEIDNSLASDFVTAGAFCYNQAANNNSVGCYGHVLINMVDFDGVTHKGLTYTTSLGSNIQFSTYGGLEIGLDSEEHNETTLKYRQTFKEVSDVVDAGAKVNTTGSTCTVTSSSSDYEKLLSKFNVDGTAKSLKQWIVDLYYITENKTNIDGYPSDADFCASITDIQNTLSGSLTRFNEPVYNQAVTDWENRRVPEPTPVADPGAEPTVTVAPAPGAEPVEPTYVAAPTTEPTPPTVVAPPGAEPTAPTVVANPGPAPTRPTAVAAPGAEPKLDDYIAGINKTKEWDEVVNHATFSNKDLAQWYINVWCKMEGLNDTPSVEETIVHDDATNTNKAIYSVQDRNKSLTTYGNNPFSNAVENDNYIVIDDAKLKDNTWITNAVQSGVVLFQVYDKSKGGFSDTSVATSTNLNEVEDSSEVKKAEAKYEADMKKIDNKDRKYDSQLAALETERNAIKEEMETLKTVAKENVDRTFKLFS